MTRFLLIRHAQNEWVRTGRLAGWTPEVHLNEEGQNQAQALGERLADTKINAIYSSPLERAIETAETVQKYHPHLEIQIEHGVGEADFGDWTGHPLRQLARKRLWKVVQGYPSGARFPNGESFHEMQSRTISALDRIAQKYPKGTVAVFSHSDVIKAVFAFYAGTHLDLFQRFMISPASISIIDLHQMGTRIHSLNDTAHYSYPRSDGSNSHR